MTRRSWVIRAVPAAAISRAPARPASNSATASDRRRGAPTKLMLTACAFWMMKISTTMRRAMPAISAVRTPLIRVCAVLRRGACGVAGAVPLAEGGGRLRVVPGGACCSVMALLLPRAGPAPRRSGPAPGWPGPSPLFPGACSRLRLKPDTSNLFLETAIAFLVRELGFLTASPGDAHQGRRVAGQEARGRSYPENTRNILLVFEYCNTL